MEFKFDKVSGYAEKKGNIQVEGKSFEVKSRMPLKRHIIGRFIFLGNTIKGKKTKN